MEHGPDSHPQLTQHSPLIARFANPEIVVPELTPPVCNATTPASNWNSAYFDQVSWPISAAQFAVQMLRPGNAHTQ